MFATTYFPVVYFAPRYWPDGGNVVSTHIARNDASVITQVTTLTPTVVNSAVYKVSMNSKLSDAYTADGSATAQEIVEGLQALLDASTVPEFEEVTWTEDDTKITGTGASTGEPFTVVDASSGGGSFTLSTSTTPKSPNHWIAENFSTGTLPANGDTVIITQLSSSQGFKWGLDQNAVLLTLLDIRADSEAPIGLPEYNTSDGTYYQTNYRDTHLKISTSTLRIGDGNGQGASRIKINTGSNACDCIVFKTSSNKADQDEATVHLVGDHANNSLQMFQGEVDIAMLPGYSAQWPTISCSGGVLRCGFDVTLGAVTVAGTSRVETRSGITTLNVRDSGQVKHIGSGNITTLSHDGGPVEVFATGTLTITTLNGYGGRTLDLRNCDSIVTITNMNIYATPTSPFTINDPNNKLVMTNAASTPNGAQSLVVKTGSGRNVRIT